MKSKSKASLLQEANQPEQDWAGSKFVQIVLTFQTIMRGYAVHISPTQLAVLLFIMDRTVGWGKRWELITQGQFRKGIENDDEESFPHAGGLKMSLNTLKNALRDLSKSGLILQQKLEGKHGTYTWYALNDKYFHDLPDDVRSKGTANSKKAEQRSEAGI